MFVVGVAMVEGGLRFGNLQILREGRTANGKVWIGVALDMDVLGFRR
jgi:hypothetical protein